MRYRLFISVTVCFSLLLGCQSAVTPTTVSPAFTTGVSGEKVPWSNTGFLNDPEDFQFVIVSDLYGGYRPGIFESAVKKINLMQPEFVIGVGDLIQGYADDPAIIDQQRKEFERIMAPLSMRFFFVPGNHDLTSSMLTEKWEALYGHTYYHFIYKNALFLCLNTEDPPITHISDQQIDYVRKVLDENTNVRWTFVFMHEPLWGTKNKGWEPIEAMLAKRPHTVFAGHDHHYVKYQRNNSSYIKLATTGGDSDLRGANVGEFDQLVWATMTDQGPILANLSLKGIFDENLVTEEKSQIIGSLFSGEWLNSDNIVLETQLFEKGSSVLHLNNPGKAPLKVSGSFKAHSRYRVSRPGIDLTIPPESTEHIPVDIFVDQPVSLTALEPLVLEVSAVYGADEQTPITTDIIHPLDIRYTWQGPELVKNGGFDQGMTGWIVSRRVPTAGTISTESGMLKSHVAEENNPFALALVQIVDQLKIDEDYHLSFKAKNLNGPNQIAFAVRDAGRDGSTNVELLVDGNRVRRHKFQLTDTMTPYALDFRFTQETDIRGAFLLWTFTTENDVVIDDISLRTVDRAKMP